MRKFTSPALAGLGLATSLAFVASTAGAHIRVLEPPARYDIQGFDTGIKSCPCGLGSSNRTCNLAVDGSDPDRSTRVSRFEAGSTITLRFEEYVDHAGRFRVAFDPDGADMADFNANILEDISDPGGTGGQVWEMQVTLPETTCSNCTLQLVQAMEVDVNTPVSDPAPISSYYACIDLELVAPGSLDGEPTDPVETPPEGEPEPEPEEEEQPGAEMPPADMAGPEEPAAGNDARSGAGTAAESGDTPLIPAGNGNSMDVGASPGGSEATSGEVAMNGVPVAAAPPAAPAAPAAAPSASSGGCAMAPSEPAGRLGFAALGLLAWLGVRRRNASRRQSLAPVHDDRR